MGLSNYWGYNPLAMFALDPRYASDPDRALDEFRDAVKALHAAGHRSDSGYRAQP
jgi:glycogen operon protein